MAQTLITILELKVSLNDVVDIAVTEPVQDVDGDWVREFRFVGTPEAEGVTPPIVKTVRVRSPIRANIEITTPNLQV